jgi:two-component sensor histidine kinase
MVLMENEEIVSADEMRRLRSQIAAIAATHDLLTLATRAEGTADHISAQSLLERTLTALQQTTNHHRVRHTLAEVSLPVKTATSLALLLNEAVSNAIKHGGGEVEVTLSVEGGQVYLEVCDDGPGFPDSFDARRAANTGLELLIALTSTDLQGAVTFENRFEKGACVRVVFPLPTQVGGEQSPHLRLISISQENVEIVPLARASAADLPALNSLVRASEEPRQEQQSMLLRAAAHGQETPPEQLVRAAGEME